MNGRPLIHAIAVEMAPRRRNYNYRLRLDLTEPLLSIEQMRTVGQGRCDRPCWRSGGCSWLRPCRGAQGVGRALQRRWDLTTTQALARSLQNRAILDRMYVRLLTELAQTVPDVVTAQAKAVLADLKAHPAVRLADRLSQVDDAVRAPRHSQHPFVACRHC